MFYEKSENIERYIKMAGGYDRKALIEILRQFVPNGASVLELGMGPGKDLLILNEYYKVLGSDMFPEFLNRFRVLHPEIGTAELDLRTMDIDKRFDAIYSNKVLHHFERETLAKSLALQANVLNEGGVVAHAFWKGSKQDIIEDTFFQYYLEEELVELFSVDFEPQVHVLYSEMDRDDSIFILAKKKA